MLIDSVQIRPTRPEDIAALMEAGAMEEPPVRLRGLTVVDGDKVLGVGGIAYLPTGEVAAFVSAADEATRYPVDFHRAGRLAMQMIRDSGIYRVIAETDAANLTKRNWAQRHGFRPAPHQADDFIARGKVLLIWERDRVE